MDQTPIAEPRPEIETPSSPLSPLAEVVIASLEKKIVENHERRITVNPVISKFATWYEKLRNAMEYHEDEVILRAAIERILKRRLLLGGNAKTTAEPLVRELLWARYLSENSAPESMVDMIERTIDLYLRLRFEVLKQHKISEATINEWIYHLLSSAIERIVQTEPSKEIMSNFMFQVISRQISLPDEQEETKNAQVYIAVRRAFARDDLAFLRYNLSRQYFGELTEENLSLIAHNFQSGYEEIQKQLRFRGREKIYNYVKKRTATFLILEDVFQAHSRKIHELVRSEESLSAAVFAACDARYKGISSKIRRAIVRSVIFIIFTKVLFAFLVEGTYERIFIGHIVWTSILINTSIPPLLMIIVSLFIRTPGEDNSKRILTHVNSLLFDERPRLGNSFVMHKKVDTRVITSVFNILWLFAFLLSFGTIVYVLSLLHFTVISMGIFVFFLAVVSFLSYRISLTAHTYTVGERQGLITPLVDFLFLPVVRVGRHLTESIGRFNFLLFVVDLFIETPFKVIFGFFEQWFLFLHAKREELE